LRGKTVIISEKKKEKINFRLKKKKKKRGEGKVSFTGRPRHKTGKKGGVEISEGGGGGRPMNADGGGKGRSILKGKKMIISPGGGGKGVKVPDRGERLF